MNKLSVIDFFCGAGGFSEGFRQMGYKIVYGFDHWKPAIETFNHNFNLQCEPKNILDFKNSIEEIERLPNTEIIIGNWIEKNKLRLISKSEKNKFLTMQINMINEIQIINPLNPINLIIKFKMEKCKMVEMI